jgi:hypothetical protein
MLSLITDPNDPNRLVLTATVSIYLDRLLSSVLSDEVAAAVREQATKDLRSNKKVRKMIQTAASEKLLSMLGASANAPQEKKEAVDGLAGGVSGPTA